MRKLLAAILALTMILSMTGFAMADEKPITVTVFRGDPGDQPTDDNKLYKLIEEEFGIKFEIEFLAGDLDETLGTKIAGEDYPDLFDGGNSAEKIIAAGALIDLMPYISEEGTPTSTTTSRICCPSWSMRTANCSSSPTTASTTTLRSRMPATARPSSSRSRFSSGPAIPRSRPLTSTSS